MKPTADQLRTLCPDVDDRAIENHLNRLGESYFDRFAPTVVAAHLNALSGLTADEPCRVLFDSTEAHQIRCTILSSDFPSVFSLIAGVLAGSEFGVTSGDIFTYSRVEPSVSQVKSRRRRGRSSRKAKAQAPRRIIDHFEGRIASDHGTAEASSRIVARLKEVLTLAAKGDEKSMAAARHRVNEMVTEQLAGIDRSAYRVLYPVQIDVAEQTEAGTWIRVVSQDTPAFLYALSTALSLHGLSIEGLRIRTQGGRIEDEICVADKDGRAITDAQQLDQIKLSVLLTKQFTYFLDQAPDPYTALSRFEHLSRQVLSQPESGKWIDDLSDPRTMQDLARVLGASDYLWEDFIRFQADALLPVLKPLVSGERFARTREDLEEELDQAMAEAPGPGEHRKALNRFKDDQIFRIDLDYILSEATTFRTMSERLTMLAELVVDRAARTAYEALADRHGHPRTQDGREVTYAALGLGKLGGMALGYASDIELIFVYSEGGQTDGGEPIPNAAFFERMVQEIGHIVEAKQEGIFHIDLRLRPYGREGPLCCTLEAFSDYYRPGGDAHALERLALVRMRPVGGDTEFGEHIRILRDQLIYTDQGIDREALREARHRQYEERRTSRPNAKFSQGTLVDLEQAVQLLQVELGRTRPDLRTPRIHESILRLGETGVLSEDESRELDGSYTFLRQLINGLRMLRGSARDLVLPETDSDDYMFLARRLGYTRKRGLGPAHRLRLDFEWHRALIRCFVARHFDRGMLPNADAGSLADLVLSEEAGVGLRDRVLGELGSTEPAETLRHLRTMVGDNDVTRQELARLLIMATDGLRGCSSPDLAVARWARYVEELSDRNAHFESLAKDPALLGLWIRLLAESDFLFEALVKRPAMLSWIQAAWKIDELDSVETLEQTLRSFADAMTDPARR